MVIRYPVDTRGLELDFTALDTHMRAIGLQGFTGLSTEPNVLYLCSTSEPESGDYESMMYEYNLYLDTLV